MAFSQDQQPSYSYINPPVDLSPDKQPIYSYIDPSFARGGGTLSPPPPPPPPPSPPPGAVAITGAGGVTFNLTFDSSTGSAPVGFTTAVESVAQWFANELYGTTTINLNVGWGEVSGYALPSNALGASSYNFSTYTYSQVVNALTAHATSTDDHSAVASLSASDPTNGGHFVVSTALAENLGLLSYTGNDGSIGFGTGFSYTFDPMNRAVGGTYDFFGTAAHEISEVLGRVALLGNTVGSITNAYSVDDLFRYSGLNARDLGAGGYFSPDGGKTNLNNFNTGGGDAGDWAGSAGFDSFVAFASSGVENLISEADLRTMDTLGWNVVSPYTGVSSADGSILMAGTAGNLVTNAGTWSFGPQQSGTGNYNILVNGQSATGGSAVELEVANSGSLYADTAQGQWYQWNGSGWSTSSNPSGLPSSPPSPPPPPPPPSSLSPDGSILMAGNSGTQANASLVTTAGTWTFGTAITPYGNLILLNGQSAANGSAIELEVANGGHLYADNSQGQWWAWNGSGWSASTNPTTTVSPDGSILLAGTNGNLVTSVGTWTFGTTTTPYGNLILLNGQSAGNGSAVELEVANSGHLYADNSQGQWWEWNGSGWSASTNPTTTVSPDGSILMAGTNGNLVTSVGTWTFGTTTTPYGNLILLNGQSAANGSAVELEVANSGHLYADNSQGQWWEWNGSGWTSSTNPILGVATATNSSTFVMASGNSQDAAAPPSDLILPKPSFDQPALSDHAFTFADVSDPISGATQVAGPSSTILEMMSDPAQRLGAHDISTVSALSFSTDNPTGLYDKVFGHQGST